MSTSKTILAILTALAALAILSHQASFESSTRLSASDLQYLTFPIILGLFAVMMTRLWKSLPKILLLALVGFLLAGWRAYGPALSNNRVIYLVRLKDDVHLAQTSRYRDKLDLVLKRIGNQIDIAVKDVPIVSGTESLRLLGNFSKDKRFEALLWGSQRWLGVLFSPEVQLFPALDRSGAGSLLQREGIGLATSVPYFGLSFAFDIGNVSFLAKVLKARQELQRSHYEAALILLSDAASVWSLSSTRSHRAYPLWLLGTTTLVRMLTEQKLEAGALNESLEWFQRALKMLKANEASHLRSAILNNQGVALQLKWLLTGRKQYLVQALQTYRSASRKIPSNWRDFREQASWAIARENELRLLDRITNRMMKVRQRSQRRKAKSSALP